MDKSCKFCGRPGHNVLTCLEQLQPIAWSLRVGIETPSNYFKLTRRFDRDDGRSMSSNVIVVFNDAEPGGAKEAYRIISGRKSVNGWGNAEISIYAPRLDVSPSVGVIGRSNTASVLEEVEA